MMALYENGARRKLMVSVPVHCPYCHSSEIITSVKMADARGGSFFCTTTIAAVYPKFVGK